MKKNKKYIFALAIPMILLTACGNEKTPVEPPKQNPVFKVNEIKEFDTHTSVQNEYLADSYSNISKYGNGAAENSKPNSITISWEIEDTNFDLNEIVFKYYLENDKENSIEYKLDKSTKLITFTNLQVGANYTYELIAKNDKDSVSQTGNFTTKNGIARFIDIDGLSNVRDCGGWTGLDGKKIKQGLLYRGEELNQQNNGRKGSGSSATIDSTKVLPDEEERQKEKPYGQKITAKGIDTFVNELKIKTECDIRGYETFDWSTNKNEQPVECGGLKEGNGIIQSIKYTICPVHTNHDKLYYDDYGKAAVKAFFGMLADKDNCLPLYFHCAQGKDRTGFLAYLFETFLGVSSEDCMRDYLLSNLGKTGSVSESKLVGSSAQYNYVDYLNGNEVKTSDMKDNGNLITYRATGSTNAERAYNYLLSCGLTATQLDTIRTTFLED